MAKTAAGKKLVIVESPTKAKTIRKFLGKDYIVESCMGHVRDLPKSAKDIPAKYKKHKWATLGVNVDDEFDPIYCVPRDKEKVVSNLKKLLDEADELILATDEDREGESISWHLVEVLKPKVPFKRMVFNEITKEGIQDALKHLRKIDTHLVHAQEARRILDRLVGYTISPLVWKKVAYGLSAGRVQSVAVRLISERELQRLKFVSSQYWGLQAVLEKKSYDGFESKISTYDAKRVASGKDFDENTGELLSDKKSQVVLLNEKKAQEIKKEIEKATWQVLEVEENPVSRKPPAPFITSTLQQEANRKMGWGARETMRVAQSLYEQGYITYMRTDSTFLSEQALTASRKAIKDLYGKDYLPDAPRDYASKKVKGAQEAHEAIRPATDFHLPDQTGLSGDQFKLYDLIWKRTMASQMKNAEQKQVSAKIQAGKAVFGATGMSIVFPGFLRAYVEGSDDPEAALEDREVVLPPLKKGETLQMKKVEPTSHETKPPARYTEASLVQTMEKEGIGRPSTYASIIGTIVERGYARKVGNALVPTFTAMVVAKLLSQHLSQYVDLGFTSKMEQSLDDIADGELDWVSYLKTIYHGKMGLLSQVTSQEKKIDAEEARAIRFDKLKDMEVRVGRFGAYVCKLAKKGQDEVCASLPDSAAPADLNEELVNQLIDQKIKGVDALCKDPQTKQPVYVLNGRFGPYVQLGDIEGDDAKPKRMAIPAGVAMDQVTPKMALDLLSMPKTLGKHPGNKKDVKVGIGRFGPYVVCDGDYRSIPKAESIFEITFERALEMLAQPKKGRGKAAPLKDLGKHPDDAEAVQVMNGKYGPYVKWGKMNASVPQDVKPEAVTLKMALEWLSSKETKPSKASKGKKVATKSASKAAQKVATKAQVVEKTKKTKASAKSKSARV